MYVSVPLSNIPLRLPFQKYVTCPYFCVSLIASCGTCAAARISPIGRSIAGGDTISAPLQKSAVFPPMVISMIAVGEQTGGLDEMLTKIADFYDSEVEAAVKALTSILEPVMIMFVGGIVGVVVISMYMPLFSIYDNIR